MPSGATRHRRRTGKGLTGSQNMSETGESIHRDASLLFEHRGNARQLQVVLPTRMPGLRARLAPWLRAQGLPEPAWEEFGAPDAAASVDRGLLEPLFRWLENRIYAGRSLPFTHAIRCEGDAAREDAAPSTGAASTQPLRIWVTVGSAPLDRLEEAVRERIGRRGETLPLVAWDLSDGVAKLLYRADCCLDHNSLTRSIGWTLAKVPSVIRAAIARGASAPSAAQSHSPPAPHGQRAVPASRLLLDLARHALDRLLWLEQWNLQIHGSGDPTRGTLGALRGVLRPPRNRQWADPFLLQHGGRQWVFFEELCFGAPRGHIALVELGADGTMMGPSRVALSEPWHLSYPFLWREGDQLFMIPESAQHRTVDLYACEGDLTRWRRRATLLEGQRWVDATVARFEGRLWMFCTNASNDEACMHDELHAFWAERIDGPWQAHRLNPLKIDARSARPAGRMWVSNGRLHRPVQDCSAEYGGAVSVQRVDVLDPQRFEETEVARIRWPGPGAPKPWHTLNTEGGTTVVDVLGRRLRWW